MGGCCKFKKGKHVDNERYKLFNNVQIVRINATISGN